MTKNEIICEILEQTTPDELMFDLENADIEWYTDVVCDVVFQRTVGYRDVYEALCWFAENYMGDEDSEEETRRRDEKNGLYGEYVDYCN